jgi:hypothetical protein
VGLARPVSDGAALALWLERTWNQAFPGREAAERNEVLRTAHRMLDFTCPPTKTRS